MNDTITFRDGDIYFWRWKDDERTERGSYAYHCKSMKAVVRRGELIDTYWGSPTDGSYLSLDKIDLDLKGNENDLREIYSGEAAYYEAADVVDMRHPNNTHAKVYVKPEAKRSQARMLELLRHKRDDAESAIRSAQFTIERLDEAIARVEGGELDGYLP